MIHQSTDPSNAPEVTNGAEDLQKAIEHAEYHLKIWAPTMTMIGDEELRDGIKILLSAAKRSIELERESLRWYEAACNSKPTIKRLQQQYADCKAQLDASLDGNRPLPFDREILGKKMREVWLRVSLDPRHLTPWADLSQHHREAYCQIAEEVARWTLIGDATARCKESDRLP